MAADSSMIADGVQIALDESVAEAGNKKWRMVLFSALAMRACVGWRRFVSMIGPAKYTSIE